MEYVSVLKAKFHKCRVSKTIVRNNMQQQYEKEQMQPLRKWYISRYFIWKKDGEGS